MLSKLSNWISSAFIEWLTAERPYEGIPLCDFERIRYELRPCDVLLVEGRNPVSDAIRSITQSSWSHAALYIGRLHDIEDPKIRNLILSHYQGPADTQLIIEGIMGKGIIISSLTNYIKDHIRLCRPRGISRQDSQNVIAYAAQRVGAQYAVREALDLGRFVLPWTFMPRKMRSKLFEYNAGESTKAVCSSMIAEAFASVEFPILPLIKKDAQQSLEFITRNPKLYTPRDFDYSPYFDIIKYPFVEFADYAMYRKLPWNREGLISHDDVGVRPAPPTLLETPIPKKKKKKRFNALNKIKERFVTLEKEILDKKTPILKDVMMHEKTSTDKIDHPETLEENIKKPDPSQPQKPHSN